MLYAAKNDLHASVARDILHVRERELQYYTTNINNIGLQASLLAGFAFTTLANHNSHDMLSWIRDYTGSTRPFVVLARYMLQQQQTMQVVLEVLYLTSTISAMGSTLYTLYICLLTTILGPGLALRGPEGSVDKSVYTMARVNRRVIDSFAGALNLFQSSVLLKAFLTFHVIAAAVCTLFVIYYMYAINRHARQIMGAFSISPGHIVSGRFEENNVPHNPANHQTNLFPSIADRVEEIGDRLRKVVGASSSEPEDPNKRKPSNVARQMMVWSQGPRELGSITGGLDAWFESAFGAERPVRDGSSLASEDSGSEGLGDRGSEGHGSATSWTRRPILLPGQHPTSPASTGVSARSR